MTNEQTEQVKRVLLSGNKFPSKVSIALAKIIFGDLLKTHLLGERGKPRRGARDGERTQTIPISLEDLLRGEIFAKIAISWTYSDFYAII